MKAQSSETTPPTRAEIAQAGLPSSPAEVTKAVETLVAERLSANSAAALEPPEQIGPYHILSLLDEGGMGSVYKAEQRHPIRRTVALKLIKLGFDTREILARFASERQALARMDHPHIAKVLDAGTSDTGRPFFVMEYVPGRPVTQFADENKLTINQRLDLFIQVCEAINHAHTKALIHRDIKANNVLAYMHDGKATVKVIDFGIAKALTGDRLTDQTFNTERGRVIGTYETMSPEQADGSPDIDTRTDVYSLGVLLYELLSGAKPFDREMLARAGDQEIRRIIREVEPPRPSTRLSSLGDEGTHFAQLRQSKLDALANQLRIELEWIPLKAMRKERSRRYDSPMALRHDINNYLQGRPLLAGPETRIYKLQKYVGRNARGVVASAATILLLVAGTIFYIHSIRAEQARTASALLEADRQKVEALFQKQEAQKQEAEAKQQASIAEATNSFLSDMLASADPQKLLGDKVTVLQAVQAAVMELDAGKLKDQPLTEVSVRNTISATLWGLGQYDAARPNLEKMLEIRRKVLPVGHPDIAQGVNNLAVLLIAQRKLAEAEPLLRDALEMERNALPAGDPEIATSLNNLATLLKNERKFAEAEQLCREALAMRRKFSPEVPRNIADSMDNLASLLQAQGKLDEAERLFRDSLELERKALPSGHPEIATSLNNLGFLLQERGKLPEAESLYREALQIRRKALPTGHPELAETVDNLASLLHDRGKLAEAEPLYREALKMYRKALPPDHPDIAGNVNNLAVLLQAQGKLGEAEALFREALEVSRKALLEGHPDVGRCLNNLATVLQVEGKLAESEPLYREALEIYLKALPAGHPEIATTQENLAGLLYAQGKFTEAETLYREALEIRKTKFGARGKPTTQTAAGLAKVLDETKRSDEAAAVRKEFGLREPTTKPATAPTARP
jgi:serine/threonine protein kinase/Tfp pilus assembly protein PilF